LIKRLSLLNGLSILAVVINHATHRGFVAMFFWTDRYRTVSVPNYDQMGSFMYYLLTVLEKLAVFSVPSFLFFSGFFIAFAARGSQSTLSWKMVRQRIFNLALPYVIWSVVIFIVNAFNGEVLTLQRYLMRLLYGGAIPHYYFVPLICQLYILSPLLVQLAKKRPAFLLVGTALIQLLMMSFSYLGLFLQNPALDLIIKVMHYWTWFPMWIFFFAFGVYAGFHLDALKNFISRWKWVLLGATFIFGALAVLEANGIFTRTSQNWRDTPLTLPSTLYALTFMMAFLAFEKSPMPLSKLFTQLSSKSYGIYLTHTIVLGVVAWWFYRFMPDMLAYQAIFQPLLVASGIGIPLVLMIWISRSPASKMYRFLFG
jgi:membrane-bound acyltransferase YfiQ involved in biofilm formation